MCTICWGGFSLFYAVRCERVYRVSRYSGVLPAFFPPSPRWALAKLNGMELVDLVVVGVAPSLPRGLFRRECDKRACYRPSWFSSIVRFFFWSLNSGYILVAIILLLLLCGLLLYIKELKALWQVFICYKKYEFTKELLCQRI